MQCNFAILHQFPVLAFVLTLGDFLCHTVVHQTLYLAVDIVGVAFVAKADVNILSCEGIGQSAIAYPCLLLVCATRCLMSFQVVVVLFANSQEEVLLECIVSVYN